MLYNLSKQTKINEPNEVSPMNSISQIYNFELEKIYKRVISNDFSLNKFNSYIEMMDSLQKNIAKSIREAIKLYFEQLDANYCKSSIRRKNYYYSGTYIRTLITVFGEVQFSRKYYYPKNSKGEGFYYVDDYLNLPKYDNYDPIIKSMVIEEKAKSTYALAAEIVSKKISEYSGQNINISRQLAFNIFKEFEPDLEYLDIEDKELLNEDNLYIMLDEKYVHTQDYLDDKTSKAMIKHAVIYTGKELEYKNRYKLTNKQSFSILGETTQLVNKVQKFIDNNFNTDNIKNIIISGDGASWIMSFYKDFSLPNKKTKLFVLDPFHVGQAITRLTTDKLQRELLRNYIEDNRKKDFITLCESILKIKPERKYYINDNKKYIIDKWSKIQNAKNDLFIGCPMESHISHDLAKVFARDPKAYSKKHLPKHILLRELNLNKYDLKSIYLYSNNFIEHVDNSIFSERLLKPNFIPLSNANNSSALLIINGTDNILKL